MFSFKGAAPENFIEFIKAHKKTHLEYENMIFNSIPSITGKKRYILKLQG
jgi:hypothetical protein